MKPDPADAYVDRFRRVLDHVDAHLDDDLTVGRLSRVACFSKHHFHRQFSELFGIGISKYVQLLRLRRASYQLAFRNQPIIEIALESGYESPEAFARAFKKHHGQTPTEFRSRPQWEPWHATQRPLTKLRSLHMTPDTLSNDVTIIDFEETPVAVLEHRGDPTRVGESVRQFIAWRKQHGLPPKHSATFNIFYGDPDAMPATEFHIDICAAMPHPIAENDYGVVAKTLPAGRCAVLRHIGSDDTLGHSIRHLYASWLPASGEEPRDFPLFLERVRFFPDVPEHEAVTDIHLPLR